MPDDAALNPPIVLHTRAGDTLRLASVKALIDYVRQCDNGATNWIELREAAFVAMADPSANNLTNLRQIAEAAFALEDDAPR